jgi:quinohemoprotein ethanol dehydrogenase
MRQIGHASLSGARSTVAGIPLKSLAAALLLSLAASSALAAEGPANVDSKRLVAADKEPGNWMSTGRTYDEQRYSPLKQISDQNVG